MKTLRMLLAGALLATVLGIAAAPGAAGADPVDQRYDTRIVGGGYLLQKTSNASLLNLGVRPTLKMSARLLYTHGSGSEDWVSGAPIVFHIGSTYICSAYTGYYGVATCSLPTGLATVQLLLTGKAEASFPGTADGLKPSNGTVTAIGPDIDPHFFPI